MAKLGPRAVLGIAREVAAGGDPGHLAVTGPRGLADALRKELGRGADPGTVRGGPIEGAAALVHVLAAAPDEADRELLKAADRARVPIVAVLAGPGLDDRVPFVLATDVVQVPAGSGFPVDRIAEVLAARLGEQATGLAARLPVLREPVVAGLIERFARMNGMVGAAVFLRGADFPVMTLNQIRMVLRIAHAYGVDVGQERAPEVLATVGSGYALRAVARRALARLAFAGWALRGAVGYGGTRAVGEAARRYFAERAGSRTP
ncbi:MAG TPA: hypothetical protein VLB86_07715 [Gaiellaceae bacterium]|nr:hypothetical protein [Gaiellaceae bacterium]